MDRQSFERRCAEQNAARAAEREQARTQHLPCDVTPMLAFGGVPYCRTHGVVGECPYGRQS